MRWLPCLALLLLLVPGAALGEVRGEVLQYGVYSTVTSGETGYFNEMTSSESVIDEVTDIVIIYRTGLINLGVSESYEFGYEYRVTGCKAEKERVTFYTRQDGQVIDRWSDMVGCGDVQYWGWNDWDAIRRNWRFGVPVTFGAEHFGVPLFEFEATFEE